MVAGLLSVAGVLAVQSPAAQATGSGWQNANGSSTTATGQASTGGGQSGLVFAIDTGSQVTGCSSPQGSCSVGQPDGSNSFEVFATSPSASISFSVTTSAPIACSFSLPFKVSFTGTLPYVAQDPIPTGNTCSSPPPANVACPLSNVRGYFEPTQAVWQDDPTTAADHFPDKPGKQLTQTSPTSYTAELPMVQGKPTLLFGIDHAQNALGDAPHDRYNIVIQGTTMGDTLVPVKMKFTGVGAGATLDYTTPILDSIYLDGTCTTPRAFKVTLPAPLGAPPAPGTAFTFAGTGGYTLKDQLVRSNGDPTGIDVDVNGSVVATHHPVTYFVPVRLTTIGGATASSKLKAQSDSLRDQVVRYTPDYWPLRPGGFTGFKEPLVDASARVKADLSGWKNWAKSLITDVDSAAVTKDVLLASLTDALGLGGILGKVGRTVVVLSASDMAALDLADANGYTESQKVVFIRSTVNHFTVAHELAHGMPFLWSSDQMTAECGVDYHNEDIQIAHGFQVTRGGVLVRAPKDPYTHLMVGISDRWADQCTYWNLVNALQNPPDPLVVVVRGRLAISGADVKGQLFPAYELSSATDLTAGPRGAWAIVAKSASGSVLARYPFSPQWESSTRTRSIISFAYRVPYTSDVARIALEGPTGLLSELVWSAHAPTVAITRPSNGAVVTPVFGKVHVTWAGHDADRNQLRYTVLYSSDRGRTWEAQSVEQTGTSSSPRGHPTGSGSSLPMAHAARGRQSPSRPEYAERLPLAERHVHLGTALAAAAELDVRRALADLDEIDVAAVRHV